MASMTLSQCSTPSARSRATEAHDRVRQAPAAHLVGGLLGVDGGLDAGLLQRERQLQSGDAGPDDSDAGHALVLPPADADVKP
jgi:hypothetical protein